ncbi:hypothetical protein [Sorangium sp. So ce385]|uniref:hypothetical protein n=1 Tax=Sorangium sp. So ce385 TaxID=3133308 RepID=UPI003F5C9863
MIVAPRVRSVKTAADAVGIAPLDEAEIQRRADEEKREHREEERQAYLGRRPETYEAIGMRSDDAVEGIAEIGGRLRLVAEHSAHDRLRSTCGSSGRRSARGAPT